MVRITPQFACRKDPLRTVHKAVAWIFLLFLLCFVTARSAAASADPQNSSAVSRGPGLSFAVADFDGDARPDIASIQPAASSSGTTDYRIQLQLTAFGRQSIQLYGPSGGLFIQARDVNGDQAVDLVLDVAWSRTPVAIFLNDGHGRFSRAEPTAFPGAFSQPQKNWASDSNLATDAVGIAPSSSTGICPEISSLRDRSPGQRVLLSYARFLSTFPFVCRPGRAPPLEVSYL
jgi:hypothetical protein